MLPAEHLRPVLVLHATDSDHFLSHSLTNCAALRLEYDVSGRLHHGIPVATVLDPMLQLLGLLRVLLLLQIIDGWPCKMNSLEHLNVLFNLFALLVATVDVVEGAVVGRLEPGLAVEL